MKNITSNNFVNGGKTKGPIIFCNSIPKIFHLKNVLLSLVFRYIFLKQIHELIVEVVVEYRFVTIREDISIGCRNIVLCGVYFFHICNGH